jgi:hypothetical protein
MVEVIVNMSETETKRSGRKKEKVNPGWLIIAPKHNAATAASSQARGGGVTAQSVEIGRRGKLSQRKRALLNRYPW